MTQSSFIIGPFQVVLLSIFKQLPQFYCSNAQSLSACLLYMPASAEVFAKLYIINLISITFKPKYTYHILHSNCTELMEGLVIPGPC